jgi:hypothetical protein
MLHMKLTSSPAAKASTSRKPLPVETTTCLNASVSSCKLCRISAKSRKDCSSKGDTPGYARSAAALPHLKSYIESAYRCWLCPTTDDRVEQGETLTSSEDGRVIAKFR